MADAVAAEIIRDQGVLAGQRGNFEAQWQEIAERIVPSSSQLFFSAGAPNRSTGQKNTEKMLDSTAAVALERYASVLASLLTPQSQKWHRLKSNNANLNKIPRVQMWFDAATDILFQQRMSPRSGFDGQMNVSYASIGAFGTGVTFISYSAGGPTDPGGGLRYRTLHMSEGFLRENYQGVVDTVMRKFPLKHRELPQMLAAGLIDVLPSKLEELLKDGRQRDNEFSYIHCIKPNTDYDPGRADYRGRPYIEHYVCVQTQETIGTRGYYSFPYAVGRPVVAPGEVYGRSPAMLVLPNVKVLNEQKKTALKVGHRLSDPIILAHDDGVIDNYSARPGAVVSGGINAQGQRMMQRLDDNVGQLPQLADLMTQEREVINDAFLVSLFQILIETPRMTATEVLERTREKSMLLAPTMGRLQGELLGPMIERELDLMIRAGRMPPMPQELIEARGEYHVQYDNPLSRAMRAEEAAGMARWTEGLLAAAQITQDPSALDWVEWDIAAPELADINSVPARWVSTPEAVAAKRKDRNNQQAVQNAIDAAPGVAGLVKAGAGGPR